jgi:hypothetical protein
MEPIKQYLTTFTARDLAKYLLSLGKKTQVTHVKILTEDGGTIELWKEAPKRKAKKN